MHARHVAPERALHVNRYDGEFFKKGLKTHGTYSIGQMELYDVGMASMFVSEADALATLATAIGRTAEATKLKDRADKQRKLIATHMWDEQGGIYTNVSRVEATSC